MLDGRGVDVAGLLEQGFVIPVGVDDGELAGDQVVIPDEDGVDGGQDGLFIDTRISG